MYGKNFKGMDCMDICAGRFNAGRCRDMSIHSWAKVKALPLEYGFDSEHARADCAG